MFLGEIPYPGFNEIAFSIFGFPIRWYGLSYVLAFVLARTLLRRLSREGLFPAPLVAVDDLLFSTMLGTVLGGRLGYILFYKPAFYFHNPGEIIRIWEGGLSFHGGIAGVAIAIIVFARRRGLSIVRIMDACSCSAAPGIFCVRLANFVNGELWGRPTSVPWAMVFPKASPAVPRHPSQLYEALLEGVFLFVLTWFLRRSAAFRRRGRIASTFVLSYGLVRFGAEFTREPDHFLGTVLGPFSMGQILCAAMILIGVTGLVRTRGDSPEPESSL